MNFAEPTNVVNVILSEAKNLSSHRRRFFASLRMTFTMVIVKVY